MNPSDSTFTFNATAAAGRCGSGSHTHMRGSEGSGAGLFAVAAEGMNLLSQNGGTLEIAAGEGHGQGEFQLLPLMVNLGFDRLPAGGAASGGRAMGSGAAAGMTGLETRGRGGRSGHGHFLPILAPMARGGEAGRARQAAS
jgi:hypothetical protein